MRIKQVRMSKGMTQKDVAKAIGVDVPLVCKIETYKCLPVPSDMDTIAELFNCSISDMYDSHEITYTKQKGKKSNENVYKVCVRFPKETKEKLKELFKICGYHSVGDWVYACYRRLEAQAKIIEKKSKSHM